MYLIVSLWDTLTFVDIVPAHPQRLQHGPSSELDTRNILRLGRTAFPMAQCVWASDQCSASADASLISLLW